jgi:hypothetical protein
VNIPYKYSWADALVSIYGDGSTDMNRVFENLGEMVRFPVAPTRAIKAQP